MDPFTLGAFALGTAGTQFLGGLFGANKKRDQARRAAKAQNRANLMSDLAARFATAITTKVVNVFSLLGSVGKSLVNLSITSSWVINTMQSS